MAEVQAKLDSSHLDEAKHLTMKGRADNFLKVFPEYAPLVVHNDRIYGVWGNEEELMRKLMFVSGRLKSDDAEGAQRYLDELLVELDNNFALVEQLRGTWVIGSVFGHKTTYYGEYPYKVRERILALFPDCERIIHLFSGIIKTNSPNVITYDVKPELHPTICDDVRNLKRYADIFAKAQLVVSDPPYDIKDFEKYRVKPFDKRVVIKELGEIMAKHSFLCWLDTVIPMYSKKVWELRGHIGMVIGTNTRARMLDIWEHT